MTKCHQHEVKLFFEPKSITANKTLQTFCSDNAGLFYNEDEYVLIESYDVLFANVMIISV